MKSWEVLRDAVERVGVKAVAAKLHLSTALVYKWCQPYPTDDDPLTSGARNPLDRLRDIIVTTADVGLVNWLCNAANGFYVANPDIDPHEQQGEFLSATQLMVEEFGDLLSETSHSIADDNQITAAEADRIRLTWEKLKGQAESFVTACERGLFRKAP